MNIFRALYSIIILTFLTLCSGSLIAGGSVATFEYTYTCIDDSVYFDAIIDAGQIDSIAWDFGDGSPISHEVDPVHKYDPSLGLSTFNVQLTVRDTSTPALTETTTNTLTINPCPKASFEWDEPACYNLGVNFYIPNHDYTFSYDFYFGDGSTLNAYSSNETHYYNGPGTYTVKLIVTDYSVSPALMDSVEHTVQVDSCSISAFNYQDDCPFPNMRFKALADGGIVYSYSWNFDDTLSGINNTSTLRTPDHTFTENGNYNVRLVVQDYAGVRDTTYHLVTVSSCPEMSDFSWTGVCSEDVFQFTHINHYGDLTQQFDNFIWNFDDPNSGTSDTSTAFNPTHVFSAEGNYNVSLIAEFEGEVDTTTFNVFVGTERVDISALSTEVCAQETATLTASNSGNYEWNNGLGTTTTVTPVVTETTQYFVRATDANGCISEDSVVIDVFSIPVLSTSVSNTTCGEANGEANVTAFGGAAPYTYLWSNDSTTSTIQNILAGSYHVLVTDSRNCTAHKYVAVSDTDGPSVTITKGEDANCGGADGTATSNVTGGTPPYTYSWSNGDTLRMTFSLEGGSHTLAVTDDNGCIGTDDVVIENYGNNPPVIRGRITRPGNLYVTSGSVTLYRKSTSGGVRHDSITTVDIDGTGVYYFRDVLPIGKFVIQVNPDPTLFPNTILSYFMKPGETPSTKWGKAWAFDLTCDTVINANVRVIDLTPLSGTSKISGNVSEIVGFGKQAIELEDAEDIKVSLEHASQGIVAQTQTDTSGMYEFDNIPNGEYTIHVDIPGLPMDSTYDISIETSNSEETELDFIIGDTNIYIEDETTSIVSLNGNRNHLNIYPNPYTHQTTIAYTLSKASEVKLEVYNLLGVQVFEQNKSLFPGKYEVPFSAQSLGHSKGMYFVKLRIGENNYVGSILEK